MTPEQFRRVSDVFDAAAPLSGAERARLLDQEFANEPALRHEIDALLVEHDRADAPVATAHGLDVLNLDALDLNHFGAGLEELSPPAATPVLKGTYRLLRTIGEGGMGVVYEAEQAFPRRRVALKGIRPGLASKSILRRFRNEIEMLARLHHPGIAQIYEAGVADEEHPDQAFFVMELVDGGPLNRYARDRRLGTRERLELLLAVCDAVNHAHQRGVIHRDLKPGNILVNSSGQPKILDFGIARAADRAEEETMHTLPGQVVGTPSYMSPEQLAGHDVDTRSDVYSLGVIAFELLTGQLPLDLSGTPVGDLARVLRTRAPRRVGQVDKSLRGDIEVVLATAMHPDVERRYSSASALAEDIRNVLDDRPIRARADSAWYVLSKVARRHRVVVSLGIVLLVLLVAFGVLSTVMAARNARLAFEAETARDVATSESKRAQALSGSLEQELAATRVERGRAEARAGLLRLAEDTLWREHLTNPESSQAKWGLWELYERLPCEWTVIEPTYQAVQAISSDGSLIAMANPKGELTIRRGIDGSIVARGKGAGAPVTALAVDARRQRVFAGLRDGKVVVIDVASLDTSAALGEGVAHAGGVRCLALSGDGSRLVAGGADKRLSLWNADAGTLIEAWDAHADAVQVLAISDDGTRVASATTRLDSERMLWNVESQHAGTVLPLTGQPVTSLGFVRGSHEIVVGLADFSEGGSGFSVGVIQPGTLSLSVVAGNLGGLVRQVSTTPSGKGFAIASGFAMYLCDGDGVRQVRSLGTQQGSVTSCRWRADGGILSVAVLPGGAAEVRGFAVKADPALTRVGGFDSWCFSSAWSRESGVVALDAGGKGIAVHDERTLERRAFFPIEGIARARAMKFVEGSTTLVVGASDGRIRIIDTTGERPMRQFGEPRAEIFSLIVSPDGKQILTGHADMVVRVWNVDTGELVRELPRLERRVEGMALSTDGGTLVTSGLNRAVQLWKMGDLSQGVRLATDSVPWGVAIRPDGAELAVSTFAGAVEFFDLTTLTRKATIAAHQRLVPGIAYSPDGTLLATCSEDSSIRLWDATTYRPLVSMETNSAELVHVSFDATSRYLSVSASGRVLLVYDLRAIDRFIEGNRSVQAARVVSVPQTVPMPAAKGR